MNLRERAAQAEGYIIERRRFYHACPELAGREKETRAALRRDLEALGITEITEMQGCYGLTAMIRGGGPGKTIALRADMDGLPVKEGTGLAFAAQNGAMHACGHDTHMAMLLGAAKLLLECRGSLGGNVKLIFQPAEELAKGAGWMLAEGAMEGVDALCGAHIWGNFDAPLVDVSAGRRMAGCDTFTIEVSGRTAHGSAPHLGVDAIAAAAAIIQNVQQVVSRFNDPLNPLVITIGEIKGGTIFNSVADRVFMKGTVRSFTQDGTVEKGLRQVAEQTAAAFGATVEIGYERVTIPVVNGDEGLNRLAREAVVKLYGPEGLGQLDTLMGSEDFSWLGQGVPSVFAFVGSRNREKGLVYTNHHEKYDVDESVLQRGAAVLAQIAVDFLLSAG